MTRNIQSANSQFRPFLLFFVLFFTDCTGNTVIPNKHRYSDNTHMWGLFNQKQRNYTYEKKPLYSTVTSENASTDETRSIMSQIDIDEEDCPICCEKGALKSDGVVRCRSCRKYVCGECYDKIHTSKTVQLEAHLGIGAFRVGMECPFCKNPNF